MTRWTVLAGPSGRCAMAVCAAILTSAHASGAPEGVLPADPAEHAPQHVSGHVLVKFKDHVVPNSSAERAALQATQTSVIRRLSGIGVAVVRVPIGASEPERVQMLNARPEVEFAELDEFIPPADVVPNDPLYSGSQWALQTIECPAAWSTTTGNESIVIAILDTGVDASHADLAPKLVPGWNIYNNNDDTGDVTGHGTTVAGMAATTDNSLGIASAAWACKIMPVRISSNSGMASFSLAAEGLTWAMTHGAKVANISYKMSHSSSVQLAAEDFQNACGVVTIAAGNQGTAYTYPDNPYVLTVSATDSNDAIAVWSNTGTNIDIASPGQSVQTTIQGGEYGVGSGTSYSAPIVAAVAALVMSANSSLTGQDVQDIIKLSATDLGPTEWDPQYGAGRVNAAAAVAMALEGMPPSDPSEPADPPPGDTSVPTISIIAPANGVTVSGQVNVPVSYSDDEGVVKVELYVDGVLKNTKTNAPFTTKWNSNPAPSGPHVLLVKAYDDAGNVGESPSVTVYK